MRGKMPGLPAHSMVLTYSRAKVFLRVLINLINTYMNKLLLLIPLFFISCEKEVIEPAKYFPNLNSGKPATEMVDKKKPCKLRIRKRKRRYEKINKITVGVSSGLYKHDSSSYIRNGDSIFRNTRPNNHPNH
jgi:hypothetical protein